MPRHHLLRPGLIHYRESSSVFHPLYSKQGERSRLVHPRERVEQAGLCTEGYRIVRRDPSMAYGGFNKRVYERVDPGDVHGGMSRGRHRGWGLTPLLL
jgi:hypothetical protein